jgi:hypothetical protein
VIRTTSSVCSTKGASFKIVEGVGAHAETAPRKVRKPTRHVIRNLFRNGH